MSKRLFNDGLKRIPFFALFVCITLFLGYSFHGHGDWDDHSDDCSICAALINSSALPAVVISLTFCFLVLFSYFRFVCQVKKSPDIYRQGSRAPPFFV